AGGNPRRIRGALQPLLRAAPLSKSAVSRVVATLKDGLAAWRTRSLSEVDAIYLYLDAFALRVRSASKVVSVGVVRRVEGLPGRPRGTRAALPRALHHRRQRRPAPGARPGVAAGRGA